jgi:hypothetical protein
MELEKPVTTKRSLGSLRRAQKGKPKSPDMIGTLNLQRHTASAILKVFAEAAQKKHAITSAAFCRCFCSLLCFQLA